VIDVIHEGFCLLSLVRWRILVDDVQDIDPRVTVDCDRGGYVGGQSRMRAASDREENRRRRLEARPPVDDHDISSSVSRDSLGDLFPKAARPSTAWDDKRVHITGPDRVQDPFHNVTGVEKVSIHVWECVVGLFERPVKKCSIVAVGHRTTVDFRGLFGALFRLESKTALFHRESVTPTYRWKPPPARPPGARCVTRSLHSLRYLLRPGRIERVVGLADHL